MSTEPDPTIQPAASQIVGSMDSGVYVAECYDSPQTNVKDSSESVTHLKAVGYQNEVAAYTAVQTWISSYRATYLGLYPYEVALTPIGAETGIWDARITYRVYHYDETDLDEYQFSTSGGQEKIYYSYGTQQCKSIEDGTAAADEGGAVNVKEDGTIEGIDTKYPAMQWTQTQNFSFESITAATRKLWAEYTNCVNSQDFMGYAAGEVMFDGVSGSLQTRYDKVTNAPIRYWKVSFTFSVRRNRTVNYGAATFTARGWDHTWVKWGKVLSADGSVKNVPLKVLSDQVYPYVNLNGLNLHQI